MRINCLFFNPQKTSHGAMSNSLLFGLSISIFILCLGVWVSVCLFTSGNGSTKQAQILCGTLQNPIERLLMLSITKSCLQKSLIFVKFKKPTKKNCKSAKRNWAFVTNSDFLIPIFFPPDGVNLWYFNLRFFHLTEFVVWNILGLRHWVARFRD